VEVVEKQLRQEVRTCDIFCYGGIPGVSSQAVQCPAAV